MPPRSQRTSRQALPLVLLALAPLAPRTAHTQAHAATEPWADNALAAERRATLLVQAMTLPEKLEQMVGTPGIVPELPQCFGARHVNGIRRLGIPTLRITNGPVVVGQNDCIPPASVGQPRRAQGSRLSARATALPAGIAVAASFDTAVAAPPPKCPIPFHDAVTPCRPTLEMLGGGTAGAVPSAASFCNQRDDLRGPVPPTSGGA